jgi:catechol 2,3-dioxygenase-like lactoylglutathione lyase family enzyme
VQTLGLHHVSVNVPDVDAALAFYVDVLGAEVRTDRPDFGFAGAWLDFGGQQVHLLGLDAPANLGQHFALAVADLAAAVDEVRAKGWTITDPVPVAGNLQAFLDDPAGNTIELHQVGGAA